MGDIRATDLAADSRVSEILIANRTAERAEALAGRVGGRAIDWDSAAETPADAYVMALATDAHGDMLDRLLEHSKPVLCEKPIALTIADTQRICDKVEASNAQMQIGFQRRFDAGMARTRDMVASGELGRVYDLVLASRDHTPPGRDFLPGSGGIFRDLHVHDFDIASWIVDSPIATVQATRAIRGEGAYAEFDDADVTKIIATTESGIPISITGTRHDARGHDVRLEVFGSQDSVSAGITPRTPLLTLDSASVGIDTDVYSGFIDRFRDAFRSETAAFVDLITGAENPCPPKAALDALRASIACERSVATGKVIEVKTVRDE
jgi:myo-inositol 2-dehydrogenase/D-chiro-inositol 1-dehydrogenase